jgi:hypothetical protein
MRVSALHPEFSKHFFITWTYFLVYKTQKCGIVNERTLKMWRRQHKQDPIQGSQHNRDNAIFYSLLYRSTARVCTMHKLLSETCSFTSLLLMQTEACRPLTKSRSQNFKFEEETLLFLTVSPIFEFLFIP